MKCRFAGLTDPGLLRPVNQDCYYADPEGRFFIVADGMGGHAGGQEASKLATQTIQSYLEQYWTSPSSPQDLLKEAISQANEEIIADQNTHPERSEMGTTVVVVLLSGEESWCAHVGDSRLYRLRDSQLEQITEDHTWVTWALKSGAMTPEEASVHPWQHVLSQCLGRKELHNIEIRPLDVRAGDFLLLCSDGLSGELSDHAIRLHLEASPTCQAAVESLVKAAKEEGGSDNITVVVVALES